MVSTNLTFSPKEIRYKVSEHSESANDKHYYGLKCYIEIASDTIKLYEDVFVEKKILQTRDIENVKIMDLKSGENHILITNLIVGVLCIVGISKGGFILVVSLIMLAVSGFNIVNILKIKTLSEVVISFNSGKNIRCKFENDDKTAFELYDCINSLI